MPGSCQFEHAARLPLSRRGPDGLTIPGYAVRMDSKHYFFLRLNSPRPSFNQDMSNEERAVMTRHVAYWTDKLEKGIVHVFGPVLDPRGTYGIGIIGVESEQERDALMANDPANGLLRYEYWPMRAVVPRREQAAGPGVT